MSNNCPLNTDRPAEAFRPRAYVGIPSSFLRKVEDPNAVGAMVNAEGATVVMAPNECVTVCLWVPHGPVYTFGSVGCAPTSKRALCPCNAFSWLAHCGVASGGVGRGCVSLLSDLRSPLAYVY